MTSDIPGIPTPGQWVDNRLRQLKISNSALARIVGQDRTQVQRWVNGREQIPRHHLAEIAVQLGNHKDLEYALELKECEDLADSLKRRIRELARIGRFDPSIAESAVFATLELKTGEEGSKNPNDYASVLLYNMTHASFIFRLWQEAASSRDFRQILTQQNLKLHVQYPANHFFGLALNLASAGGLMPDFRSQCLMRLRDQAISKSDDGPTRLTDRHHAIHILGRFGSLDDQAIISEIMEDAAKAAESASIRHAFTGLTLQSGCEGLVERYLHLLQRDEALAYIDIAFDAVHYGDARLAPDRELPRDFRQITKTIANLLRRFTQPDLYSGIRELDTFRLCMLLDRQLQDNSPHPSLPPEMKSTLEQALASNRNKYTAEAEARMARILDPISQGKVNG